MLLSYFYAVVRLVRQNPGLPHVFKAYSEHWNLYYLTFGPDGRQLLD